MDNQEEQLNIARTFLADKTNFYEGFLRLGSLFTPSTEEEI